jgi:hypothetical protein
MFIVAADVVLDDFDMSMPGMLSDDFDMSIPGMLSISIADTRPSIATGRRRDWKSILRILHHKDLKN